MVALQVAASLVARRSLEGRPEARRRAAVPQREARPAVPRAGRAAEVPEGLQVAGALAGAPARPLALRVCCQPNAARRNATLTALAASVTEGRGSADAPERIAQARDPAAQHRRDRLGRSHQRHDQADCCHRHRHERQLSHGNTTRRPCRCSRPAGRLTCRWCWGSPASSPPRPHSGDSARRPRTATARVTAQPR